LDALIAFIGVLRDPAAERPADGDFAAGARLFSESGNCVQCHMLRGRGGSLGPDLTNLARERSLGQIVQALHNPGALATPGYRPVTVRLRDGRTLLGLAKNESNYDLQLQGEDGTFHFLSKDQIVQQTNEPKSLMPPVKMPLAEMRNLLAFLTRLTDDAPLAVPLPASPASADGISFSNIATPRVGEWPITATSAVTATVRCGDQHRQCNSLIGPEMDVPDQGFQKPRSDASGSERSDVCHGCEPGVGSGRQQWAADLALLASAHERSDRGCRIGDQSRSGTARRQGLHGD
jgi:putative heme-binding domain-containing protein